jgi:hypothetical protein
VVVDGVVPGAYPYEFVAHAETPTFFFGFLFACPHPG